MNNHERTRPRRFQFGIKWLLVLMLLVTAFYGGRSSLQSQLDNSNLKLKQATAKIEQLQLIVDSRVPTLKASIAKLKSISLPPSDREQQAEQLVISERMERLRNQVEKSQYR